MILNCRFFFYMLSEDIEEYFILLYFLCGCFRVEDFIFYVGDILDFDSDI